MQAVQVLGLPAFQVGRLVACGCWQVREFGLEDGVILVKQY